MKNHLFAIINIGASAFRMSIMQFEKKQQKEIEYLIKPLRLGVDTFTQGYIHLEHVKQAAEILLMFRAKLEEYKITDYKALCTSGVREAKNKDFFIDYIKTHAGISLEILEPSDEVYIKYVGVRHDVPDFIKMERKGVLFANIASGNVTLSVTKSDRVLFSGTLPYGSLRLRQIFLNVPAIKRYKAFDQYVENMIRSIKSTVDINKNVTYLIGGGSSINLMIRLFRPVENKILKSDLIKLYNKIRSYSTRDIIEELELRDDEAAVLVPTLSIYIHLLQLISADEFVFSRSTFPNVLSRFYAGTIKDNSFFKRVKATIKDAAIRYHVDTRHGDTVAKNAVKLFHKLSDLHSLSANEDHVLEASAHLYEVGRFIAEDHLAENSYTIIHSLTIPGLTRSRLNKVAAVVYQMLKTTENNDIAVFADHSVENKLVISKLASILSIARAMDASKSGLITDFEVDLRDNLIIIEAYSSKDPFVELNDFEEQKATFLNTFGIAIDIRVRVTYE